MGFSEARGQAAAPEHAAFTGRLHELGTAEVVPVGNRSGRAARDRFIGWTCEAQAVNRRLVVCNSRFLIVPGLKVPHLASHVLAQCVRRLPADWQRRYGYRPVLAETFVDAERFAGTCCIAAGWIKVGRTACRGRQDRDHVAGGAVKMIFIKPLANTWQQTLCRRPDGEVVIAPARTHDRFLQHEGTKARRHKEVQYAGFRVQGSENAACVPVRVHCPGYRSRVQPFLLPFTLYSAL